MQSRNICQKQSDSVSADMKMGHTLLCVLSLFLLKTLVYGNAEESGAKATLTADSTVIPAGGSVTLTCSVDETGVKLYEWFRETSTTGKQTLQSTVDNTLSVSEGGIYNCRGRRTGTDSDTVESDSVSINQTVPDKATVTLQPNWSLIYRGETITVRCQIQGHGDTEWTYEWRTPRSTTDWTHNNIWSFTGYESSSGDYRCRGRKGYLLTEWSDAITLTVSSDRPKARLTPGTTTIPVGGRVTLTCSVDESVGWKYIWYRRSSVSGEAVIRTLAEETREISVSQGGIYRCRGRGGKPAFYTDSSDEVTIEITFSNTVTVTLQPDWPQIFSGETITVRCEIQGGGDTEWMYQWRTPWSTTQWKHNIRSFTASESSSGDYMCRGRLSRDWYSSTQWSEATTGTVSLKPKAQLSVDNTDIPAGGSVTLTCSVSPSSGWKYY